MQQVEQVISERAVVQSPVPVVNTVTDESLRVCGVESTSGRDVKMPQVLS